MDKKTRAGLIEVLGKAALDSRLTPTLRKEAVRQMLNQMKLIRALNGSSLKRVIEP